MDDWELLDQIGAGNSMFLLFSENSAEKDNFFLNDAFSFFIESTSSKNLNIAVYIGIKQVRTTPRQIFAEK